MIPSEQFDESNMIHKAPENMPECLDLKTFVGVQNDGNSVVVSKWSPTKEELEELNNGGSVYLHIIGNSMPPVSLQCFNPFYNLDTIPED